MMETKLDTQNLTVVFRLESSHKKKERLQPFIDEWQEISGYEADMMTSFKTSQWDKKGRPVYPVMAKGYPKEDRMGKAKNIKEAVQKVADAFNAWESNGCPGNEPQFGDGNYMGFNSDEIDVKCDDGYAVELSIEPYADSLWFGIDAQSERQREFLNRIESGEIDDRNAEVHIREGDVWLHQVIEEEVEVVEDESVETVIGVDPGEINIATVSEVPVDNPRKPSVYHSDKGFPIKSGGPLRQRRTRRNNKRKKLQKEKGSNEVRKRESEKQLRDTEQFLHETSRGIVEAAVDNYPAAIAIEDLTGYRKSAQNPIHDWPYAMLRNMIGYKAQLEGVPVIDVNPENTSKMCRKCKHCNDDNRPTQSEFHCTSCGYEVHADLNAAFNIGQKGVDKLC